MISYFGLEQYEKGNLHFAVKIASTLRTIFYNTVTSKAILPNLAEKYGYTINFRIRAQKLDGVHIYLGFMIGKRILRKKYFGAPFYIDSDFESYWNEIVYKEASTIYTRKQIVLFAANKWGGRPCRSRNPSPIYTAYRWDWS